MIPIDQRPLWVRAWHHRLDVAARSEAQSEMVAEYMDDLEIHYNEIFAILKGKLNGFMATVLNRINETDEVSPQLIATLQNMNQLLSTHDVGGLDQIEALLTAVSQQDMESIIIPTQPTEPSEFRSGNRQL